jgi:hypothetical protein
MDRHPRQSVGDALTLVGAACREGQLDAARHLTGEMVRRTPSRRRCWCGASATPGGTTTPRSSCSTWSAGDAGQPKAANYGVLMTACATCGDADAVRELLSETRKRKLQPDGAGYNVLIKCLCDSGRVDEAHKLRRWSRDSSRAPRRAPRRRRLLRSARI